MPEIHSIVRSYSPEKMKLQDYELIATKISNDFEKLIKKLNDESQFNLMISPTEYNNELDGIVRQISSLYSKIEEIQKLKVNKS